MKDNLVVSTLPLKPQKETNVGMLIVPTIMDFLGDIYDCRRIMSVNSLNSYKDKDSDIDIYKNDIDSSRIKYDKFFVDKEHTDEILLIIEKMYKNGFLSIKDKEVVRCDCGKVDILKNTLNSNAKLYHLDENHNVICNACGTICKDFLEKTLCLELKKDVDDTVNIAPLYLKKEMEGFSKQFKGCDILISKNRNTGNVLSLGNNKFNIDVDFMWNNFFKLFEEDNQILIASNHQLLLMYLMNYLCKITSSKQLTFVANPYVLNKNETLDSNYFLNDKDYYKKLFILYNLRWKQKTSFWSSSIIDYLNNISSTKLNNLYNTLKYMSREFISDELPLDQQLNNILISGTNFQDNIKVMKKLYKSGML